MMGMLERRDDGDVETLETYISLYSINSLFADEHSRGGAEYKGP